MTAADTRRTERDWARSFEPGSRAGRWARAAAARPGFVIGVALIVIVSALALFAPVIAPHHPDEQIIQLRLAPPGGDYLLGGDHLGRDVFSRLLYAGRVSLGVALPSMVIAVVLGVLVGALAGYYGGWVDRALMRLTDVVLVFPTFFLLILAVATFGRSLTLLIAMIGLTAWPTNARVVRALVMSLRHNDFVTAARVNGANDARIVARHLVPQLIPVVIASATIRVAYNILIESGLSYLNLGVSPPTPTWGNMVADGASWFRQAWWLVAYPGAAIMIVVLAFNLVGEGLRDLLDPAQRRRR